MENFSIFKELGQERLSEHLVNEAIKKLRLDQAILISENKVLAEAFANFFVSLMESYGNELKGRKN